MEVIKNNHTFYVDGEYSKMWFGNDKLMHWEPDTFYILENYKNKNGVYLDIGAWIGPTVLYAADIYKKVIAIEPDPVALKRLDENLRVNKFTNINVIRKALSDKDGVSKFGGNGCLGNSESTLLVSNDDYANWDNSVWSKEEKMSNIIEIETITIERLLNEQNIEPSEISLIKMDIEGGELIVVPYLKEFLKTYKPVFYLSLHHNFLLEEHIIRIINILFDIYDNCYMLDNNGIKHIVNKENIITSKISSIVFE